MTLIDALLERNKDFSVHSFDPGLEISPKLRTLIVSCADPRVDPAHVLGLALGEALVIRNIGGRITPTTMQAIGMLGAIAQSEGLNPGKGFNLIVFHHTDCGITRLTAKPDLLTGYFGINKSELDAKAVSNPHLAVISDIEALEANPAFPSLWTVSGLVYNVSTGLVETVVAPRPLRDETVSGNQPEQSTRQE
jgi:carbonic anhydrase